MSGTNPKEEKVIGKNDIKKAGGINHQDTHFSMSNDKAHAEYRHERYFYGADTSSDGKYLGNTHREHDRREHTIGSSLYDSDDIARVGRMFAFSGETANIVLGDSSVVSPSEYYAELGVSDAGRLFPETLETVNSRFLSDENQITNEAIKFDNSEFLLKNTYAIKASLAKALLAKMDYDRDLRGTLTDLLEPDGKWAQEPPEVIFSELKNRLQNSGLMHKEEYLVIQKIFRKLDDLDNQNRQYSAYRQSSVLEILNGIEKSRLNKLFGVDIEDDVAKETIFKGLSFLSKEYKSVRDGIEDEGFTLEGYISYFAKIPNAELPREYFDMISAMNDLNIPLKNKDVETIIDEYNEYVEDIKSFSEAHNSSLSASTDIVDRFSGKTHLYPTAYLAYWADKDFFDRNHTSVGAEDIEGDMEESIVHILEANHIEIEEKTVSNILLKFKDVLNENKNVIASIYDAEKDTQNPSRKYFPFENKTYHEQAQNVFRDALYLAISDEVSSSDFSIFYPKEVQSEILTSSLDPALEELKPNVNEVNDMANMVSLLSKSVSATISDRSFDKIITSPMFSNNSLFDAEELNSLRKFGKDMASASEKVKDSSIYGLPISEAIRESMQEIIYIDRSDDLLSRMRDESIGATFFQNNKALRNLEVCMDGARNPTTTFETVASLGKSCFEKLIEEYKQDAEKSRELGSNQQNALIGMSWVGSFVVIGQIGSASSYDMMQRFQAEINSDISSEVSYLENSVDGLQKSSRKLNSEADILMVSGQFVDESFAEKVVEGSEVEYTIRSMVDESYKPLPKDILTSLNNDTLDTLLSSALSDEKEESSEQILKLRERVDSDTKLLSSLKDELKDLERSGSSGGVELSAIAKKISSVENRIELESQKLIALSVEEKRWDTAREGLLSRFSDGKDRTIKGALTRGGGLSVFNLNDAELSTDERTLLIEVLASHRDNLNRKLLNHLSWEADETVENDGLKLTSSDILKIKEEKSRLSQILPSLHREAIFDKNNFTEALSGSIFHDFHFKMSEDVYRKIKKDGLDMHFQELMDEAERSGLSKDNLKTLSIQLMEAVEARSILNPQNGKINIASGSNFISSYFKLFTKSESQTLRTIENTNNFYASVGARRDGVAYVSGGFDLSGLLMAECEKAEKEKRWEDLHRLGKAIKGLGIRGWVSREGQHDLLMKLTKDGQELSEANTELMKKMNDKNKSQAFGSSEHKIMSKKEREGKKGSRKRRGM